MKPELDESLSRFRAPIVDGAKEEEATRLIEPQTPQAEDELRAIIDNAPVFLWSDLPDGYCDFLNQPWLTYFNLSLQEARGAGWATVLHPDDAAHHLESWQKSVSTGSPFEVEARFRRSDGEYRWFLTRANPLRDKTGRIAKWYGTNIDIENLKRTEGRLRQSEAYLAEAQRLSHTGSFGWTPSTGEIHWSDESFRIFEYDRSIQPTIDLVLQRIHPDDRAMMRQLFDETSRGEKDFDVTHRLLMPDGSVKFVHVLSHAVEDAAGKLEIVGTLMDVTENTRLYRDLAEREAKIRRLVDANIIGIFIWDFEGRIIEANDAFLRMVDYDREDLVSGRIRWTELTPPEWRERTAEMIREHKMHGHAGPFEKEYFRRDGSRVPVLIGAATFEEGPNQGVAFVLDLTEHKRAELALRSSEERYARAMEAAGDGHSEWNLETGEFYVSPRQLEICGYAPGTTFKNREEWVRRYPFHPEDRAKWEAAVAAHFAGREARFQMEARIVVRGETRWVSMTRVAERDASGRPIRWTGSTTDITERKRAALALADSEARFRNLTEISSDFFWETDAEHRYSSIEFGEAYVGIRDLSFKLGRARWEIPSPSPDEAGWAAHRAVLAAHQRFLDFGFSRIENGKERFYEISGEPRFDARGGFLGYRGVGRDVTERKRAEQELRRSQHYLAEAQKVSHTGSWAWSPVSNAILYWSEECYRILGYDPAQGLPSFESSFERIHPDDRPALAETIERAVREKADFQIEYRLVLPDGTRRNVRILSHPVLDASGKLVEFVGTVMDVTEQKRAKQERRAHLWFLESMDRINRAMQGTNDVELMTSGVMQEALEIFACDRVALIYPCDPDTPTYRTVMEHASPEYTGDLTVGKDLPVSPDGAELMRRCLHDPGAVVDPSLPPATRERYRIGSLLAIAVRPKGDRPYMLRVHCERSRPWTAAELRLFEETARRLGDALTSMLAHRNLLAREEELRRSQHYLAEGQKLSHTGSWAWNPISNTILYWSEECYRIYGVDPAQGRPPFESRVVRIHPEDRSAVLRAVDKAMREKADFRTEHRVLLPGGIVRNLRILAHPVLDASGELIEYLGTVVDVTEQKRAEEERKEHLWFLESMDRVNRAMQRTNDAEGMMSGVLEETLAIFGSDRAWLVYPCDPVAATSRVVMEHTRPEYPGAFALGEELPVDTQAAEFLRRVLEGPGAATDLSVPPEIRERFSIQSIIAIAVRPKGDRPYLFGLHQCSHARAWTAAERRLFEEIARRLEDALTSVLAHRNLLASEEQLRRSRAYLAEAQKVSHTGSWAWNNVTRENVYWSEECFRIHGRDPAQGLPSLEQTLADIHPEDVPGIVASLEKALREGRAWEGEYRLINFADGPRSLRTIAHPVPDPSGRVVEYIGTVVDITEQKRVEQALRSRQEMLELAQRSARAVAFDWRAEREEAWPPELEAMYGVAPGTFPGTFRPFGLQREGWKKLVHADDWAAVGEAIRHAYRTGEVAAEYRVMHADGSVHWLQSKGRMFFDAERTPVRMVGLIQDVTPLRHAEEELRTSELERARAEHALRDAREKLAQASKMASLAELSASIAHEINQPLQAIVANGHASLRWLDATPPNIEKAIRTAKRVVRDGNAAAEVVSRIRALFKHAAPAKVDLDINKLILQVGTLMADEIQGNEVSLETELGEDVPTIRADAVQIQQVIVNLVRNAIEAMAGARRKPLLIRSRRSAGHVVVDVRDQGTGLVDPEKIFEPFVSTKETGMGMGLTICRSIIEAHAGDIRVVHNEGPGVTFSFSLPIEASDAT